MKRMSGLSLFVTFLIISSVYCQDSLNIVQKSSLYDNWSLVNDAVADGDVIFVTIGNVGIRIMDTSNPDNLIEIGQLGGMQGEARDIFKEGDLLFVLDYPYGIRIIDVSDVTSPQALGLYEYNNYFPLLQATNNHMYLGSRYEDNIDIIDISDPENPTSVSTLEYDYLSELFIYDNILYVSSNQSYCYLVDITDAENPVELNDHYFVHGINSMAANDELFYAISNTEVVAYQVDENYDIEEVDRFSDINMQARIVIKDELLYIRNYNVIKILDISNNQHFNMILNQTYDYCYGKFAIGDGLLFGIKFYRGITVLDLSNLENPIPRWDSEENPLVLNSVRVQDYVFLAMNKGGIKVLDVSDLNEPVEISSFEEIENVSDLLFDGEYLIVSDSRSGLYVVDIINPFELMIVNHLYEPEGYNTIDKSGDYICATTGINGLHVIEFPEETLPTLAGSLYEEYEDFRTVSAFGNYAYCSGNGSTLKMLDISDPHCPVMATTLNLEILPWAYDIDFYDGYAYIGGSGNRIVIYQIDSPQQMSFVSSIDTRGIRLSIEYKDNYIYSLSDDGWFEVFDVSDPANPIEAGYYYERSNSGEINIYGRHAFITDTHKFRVMDCTDAIHWQNFNPVEPTEHTCEIIINNVDLVGEDFAYRDEVGIYDGNLCVGSAVFSEGFPLTVTSWRGNANNQVPGYEAGNPIIFKLWNDSEEQEYRAIATFVSGDGTFEGGALIQVELVQFQENLDSENADLPGSFIIGNPYPNPFNSMVSIPFSLPGAGNIDLKIYNLLGQLVCSSTKWYEPGNHRLLFQADNFQNSDNPSGSLNSGVYFIQLNYQDKSEIVKAIYLK